MLGNIGGSHPPKAGPIRFQIALNSSRGTVKSSDFVFDFVFPSVIIWLVLAKTGVIQIETSLCFPFYTSMEGKIMRLQICVGLILLFITTNVIAAQDLKLERVRIIDSQDTMQVETTTLADMLRSVFSDNDILVIAEGGAHFVKESREFVVGIMKESTQFNCNRIILERSPIDTFVINDYIFPQNHEHAKNYAEFRNESEKDFFTSLYNVNLSRTQQNYIKIHGIEGYANTVGNVIRGWKYFMSRYLPSLIDSEFGKIVNSAKKDHQSVLGIRDYILLNEDKLKSEIREKDVLKFYQLFRQALDDVFQRIDINALFKSNWLEGAKMRERVAIDNITDILNENRGKKFLALYGGWHVEKRTADDPLINIFSYLNYVHPNTKGNVRSWCIGYCAMDITTLESSRDYSKMYGVYADRLKQLHDFKDRNPSADKMPFFELNQDWRALTKLFGDSGKLRLISSKHEDEDLVLLQKYDEVVLFPLGHFYELIPK